MIANVAGRLAARRAEAIKGAIVHYWHFLPKKRLQKCL
jgi:hypothetical protein